MTRTHSKHKGLASDDIKHDRAKQLARKRITDIRQQIRENPEMKTLRRELESARKILEHITMQHG